MEEWCMADTLGEGRKNESEDVMTGRYFCSGFWEKTQTHKEIEQAVS